MVREGQTREIKPESALSAPNHINSLCEVNHFLTFVKTFSATYIRPHSGPHSANVCPHDVGLQDFVDGPMRAKIFQSSAVIVPLRHILCGNHVSYGYAEEPAYRIQGILIAQPLHYSARFHPLGDADMLYRTTHFSTLKSWRTIPLSRLPGRTPRAAARRLNAWA